MPIPLSIQRHRILAVAFDEIGPRVTNSDTSWCFRKAVFEHRTGVAPVRSVTMANWKSPASRLNSRCDQGFTSRT